MSVSVYEESAEWVEKKADEQGVSKAKVIRDAINIVRRTGLDQIDDIDPDDAESLFERIERLENRMEALEAGHNYEDTGESTPDNPVAAFKNQLQGQPPEKNHGKKAVTHVFKLLIEEGPLSTKELKTQLYTEFEQKYSDEDSMWQSTQRHFDNLDGIVKIGRGEWDADPTEVDTSASGFDAFEE